MYIDDADIKICTGKQGGVGTSGGQGRGSAGFLCTSMHFQKSSSASSMHLLREF